MRLPETAKQDFKQRITDYKKITDDVASLKNILNRESASFHLLDGLLDKIPVLVYFKDKYNTLLKVNQHFCDVAGVKKEDVENVTPDKLPAKYKDLVLHYASNDIDVIVSQLPKKGIVEKLFNSDTSVRTDKFPVIVDGEVIGVLGISVEIPN